MLNTWWKKLLLAIGLLGVILAGMFQFLVIRQNRKSAALKVKIEHLLEKSSARCLSQINQASKYFDCLNTDIKIDQIEPIGLSIYSTKVVNLVKNISNTVYVNEPEKSSFMICFRENALDISELALNKIKNLKDDLLQRKIENEISSVDIYFLKKLIVINQKQVSAFIVRNKNNKSLSVDEKVRLEKIQTRHLDIDKKLNN